MDYDRIAACAPARKSQPESQPDEPAGPQKYRPVIQVNNRGLHEVTRDALAALAASTDPPELFIRGDRIVRLSVVPVSRADLRRCMARAATFVRRRAKGDPIVFPPMAVVDGVMAIKNEWPFPSLEADSEQAEQERRHRNERIVLDFIAAGGTVRLDLDSIKKLAKRLGMPLADLDRVIDNLVWRSAAYADGAVLRLLPQPEQVESRLM